MGTHNGMDLILKGHIKQKKECITNKNIWKQIFKHNIDWLGIHCPLL
jgi:hypothetical protein